jgi:hypothetical protein
MGNFCAPAPSDSSRYAFASLARASGGMALAALLIAVPARAEEVLARPVVTPAYTQRTPVEIMAADPAAAAVLNKDLPGLLTDPNYAMFKTMSLKQMQQASGGDLSVVDVNRTVADLQALPPRRTLDTDDIASDR